MRVQVQGFRISGGKAVLAGVVALVVGGVVAVLSLVALGVGVMVSVVARLVGGVRGLKGTRKTVEPVVFESVPREGGALEVREIQVDEVLVVREGQREGL
jgi:hypothetical protein